MTETEAQKIRELENYLIKMPFHRDRRMNDFAYEIWIGPDDALLLDEPDPEVSFKERTKLYGLHGIAERFTLEDNQAIIYGLCSFSPGNVSAKTPGNKLIGIPKNIPVIFLYLLEKNSGKWYLKNSLRAIGRKTFNGDLKGLF